MTNAEESASVLLSPHDKQARTYHAELLTRATDEEVGGGTFKVFRGYMTEVFRELGYPHSQYLPVSKLLAYNRAIDVVERGYRNTPAMVLVLELPEVLHPVPKSLTKEDLTASEMFANLQDRVKVLENLVGGVHLPSVLQEIAQRLDRREDTNG